jgi:hypothetical protein
MRSSCALTVLLLLSALPLHAVHASQTPETCSNQCAATRDTCKLKACTKAGGHSQLHQGVCYNLNANNKEKYNTANTRCDTNVRKCLSKCK